MTPVEFNHHIDTHGPDLDHWPAEVRAGAREFANTASGHAQLDHARAFDMLLADALQAPSPIELKSRILANIANSDFDTRLIDFFAWLGEAVWRPLTVAITPLLIGFAIGAAFPENDYSVEETISSLVLYEVIAEYEEPVDAE